MSETNSDFNNHNPEQTDSKKQPVIYKYARFGILVQNFIMIPMCSWCIWYTIMYQVMTLKQILIYRIQL